MSEVPDPFAVPAEPVRDTAPTKRPTKRSERRAYDEARRAEKAAAKAAKADKAPSSTSSSRPRKATLENRLAGSLTTLGLLVTATGAGTGQAAIQADGALIIANAPSVAHALDELAKQDPRVAKALERALTVGVYGQLIGALAPLIIGIAANHGIIPANLAAVVGAEQAPPAAA